MYVCSRFPRNHCGCWCPLDVSLVPLRPIQTAAVPLSAAAPGVQVACGGTAAEQHAETPRAADVNMADGLASPMDELMEESGTPMQQLSTPRIPAAPSKSSSLESRQQPAPTSTARSLAPLFNAFTPAAVRAAQLGARYVTLRRDSKAMARLQQRAASISPDASGSGGQQPRKRARTDAAAQEQQVQQHAAQQAQQQAQQLAAQQAQQQAQQQPRARHPLQELTLSQDGVACRPAPAGQNAPAPHQAPPAAASPARTTVSSSWLVSAARPRP